MSTSPIFYDPRGARRKRVSFGVYVLAIVGVALAIACVITIFGVGLLPGIPGLTSARHTKGLSTLLGGVERRKMEFIAEQSRASLLKGIKAERGTKSRPPTSAIVAAFYAPWEDTGIASLQINAKHLTHLIPDWLRLEKDGKTVSFEGFSSPLDPTTKETNDRAVRISRKFGIEIHPLLKNGGGDEFDPKRVSLLLDSPEKQRVLGETLRGWLLKEGFQGINVDFENLAAKDYPRLATFIPNLKRILGPSLSVSIDVEAGKETMPLQELGRDCDFVVLMSYDEHASDDAPGPIASINWTGKVLESTLAAIPPDKLVMGIAGYSYDWQQGKHATPLGYGEALAQAEGYRNEDKPEDVLQFDPESLNTHYDYDDDNGVRHQVWMMDAVAAFNQWSIGQKAGVRGTALWLLGEEDPTIWSFMDRDSLRRPLHPSALEKVSFSYEPVNKGIGEIIRVESQPKEAQRTVKLDLAEDLLVESVYHGYPSAYVVKHWGANNAKKNEKRLVLTFDDGPDPHWTPLVLDELKALHVPGTFFVIGDNAYRYRGLVEREYEEGHEVGSHSFRHPNMGRISEWRARLELDATQRVIQSITGRSTVLFRPPYNADAYPRTPTELRPVEVATRLGYITVAESVDPQDWNLSEAMGHSLTGAEIADKVIQMVKRGDGNIILLHDAGGDRSRTIEALKIFVPALQAQGYTFTSVAKIAGMTREQVMPPLTARDRWLVDVDNVGFWVYYTTSTVLGIAFVIAIGLGLARIAMMTPLALMHERRNRRFVPDPSFRPGAGVLIAAFNEATVISSTIRSVLASTYPLQEVIVVDDGSTDGTGEAARAEFADEPRVTVLTQENGGKAAALNHALSVSHSEVVICVDADTQLDPEAVGLLVRHFKDEKIAAVAGNVKVGNTINLLTRWQAIEYITSQNLDRRAYAQLNAITVVPGAIGAWRRTAVLEVGGYLTDTLAEDMDLTWRLRRANWTLETESAAKAYTEAPDNLRSFFKQRFRWAFGTLQCLWKHRGAVGRHGWFGRLAIPTLWLFQVIFQALAPLVDLQLIYTMGAFLAAYLATDKADPSDWQPVGPEFARLQTVAILYGLFFVVELIAGLIAYRTDREKPGSLVWLFLQRFVYRQVMYGVVYKSIVTALRGMRTGWGKLDRKATVRLGQG